MVLPTLDEMAVHSKVWQRVLVEADRDDVDDDAPLHPVLPVAKVELLRVHHLEDFLG